jgi:hypothetical protein
MPFHNVNYRQMLDMLDSGMDDPALSGEPAATPFDAQRAVSQC